MIQPKDLYRELAALLANIDEGRTKKNILFSVLKKLENSFARDLHISNGRLYVEDLDRFLLVEPPDWQDPADPDGVIALDTEAVQHQQKSAQKVFAFGNQAKWRDDFTAVVVKKNGPWIFLFSPCDVRKSKEDVNERIY